MRCSEWLERQQKGDFVRPVGAAKSHEGPRRARGQEGPGGARSTEQRKEREAAPVARSRGESTKKIHTNLTGSLSRAALCIYATDYTDHDGKEDVYLENTDIMSLA